MIAAAIVEGHGECAAVPVLLRRLAAVRGTHVEVATPIRLPRGRLLQEGALARAIQLAAKRVDAGGWILVLLDADDDCPAQLGPRLLAQAQSVDRRLRIAVILAVREFESWFLAAADSIAGSRGLSRSLAAPQSLEAIRDAKGWLTQHMGRRYSPTVDQAALTAGMDIQCAMERSASFAKLVRDFHAWLDGPPNP